MSSGILPLETLKFQVNLNTGFFECSAYTEDDQMRVCSGNHDAAGMSGGNLQYNFGDANQLTVLWQYMINNYEQVCINAFGTYTTQYNTWKTAVMSAVQADRVNFGASITDPNDSHAIVQPYKDCLGNLLVTPECKAKYYAIRDANYWNIPFNIFRTLSCTSRMALASFFDCYINKGRFYPSNMLVNDFEAIDADDTLTADEKEAKKIQFINDRANSEENALIDAKTEEFRPRRDAMRNMGGTYFGLTYDPETQFDMNLEPGSAEKQTGTGIKLGSIDVQNVFLGSAPVSSIYLGADLLGGAAATQYSTTAAPVTQLRTNPGGWAGIGTTTAITINAGAPIWVDCYLPNFMPVKTYYTIDGTEPTTASTLYGVNGSPIILNASCTLKVKSISMFGVWEATKTVTVTVAKAPVTTIFPSGTVRTTIPFNVTFGVDEAGATTYYKLGGSTTVYTYSGAFPVTQNSPGVNSTQIKIIYWSVGATATEAEKTIIYDTSGAIPSQPVLTATAGAGKVDLSWTAATNITSYSVYRSTVAGTLGTWIGSAQFLPISQTTLSDTGLTAGTTYYYTVYAGNYQTHTDSVQKSATPTAAPAANSYRYLKILGYGAAETGQEVTTRTVELEAYVGTTNVALNKTIVSGEAASTGAAPLTTIVNGNKTTVTSGSYPIWWTATPNANVVIDLGSSQALTKLSYYGYSVSGVQRTNRFIIQGSNTNNGTDWVNIWDNSTGQAGLQPILPAGYDKTL